MYPRRRGDILFDFVTYKLDDLNIKEGFFGE